MMGMTQQGSLNVYSQDLDALGAACPEALDDEELLAVLNSRPGPGRSAALFNELYRRYHARVRTWCYRVVRNEAFAADLAQEVFVKAYRRISSYRGDSRVSTWMFSVTRNHCLTALKRKVADPLASSEPYPAVLFDQNTADPDKAIETLELYQRLRGVMAKFLTPLEIRILLLHYAYALSLGEITVRLSLANPSGAKAFIVNARRKLRRALEGNHALVASLRNARAA
jgi:RNA polymerase sigma-70 factor (ECF subfamily)